MGKLSGVIGFAIGAAVGTFVTWKVLSAKYDARLNAEIKSVREAFSRDRDDAQNESPFDENPPQEAKEKSLDDYAQVLKETKYLNDVVREQGGDYPYSIPEEDLGDNYDYGVYDLRYFSDGVLTDDDYEPMDNDDIREAIGVNWKDAIGNYGDSSVVCFCNDARQMYYRIVIDERPYSDVYKVPGYKEQ